VCGGRENVQGHHVITQERLHRVEKERGLKSGSLVWDSRSGLAICERCHTRHTSAFRRIPRSCLSVANWAFINELGLDWWIARYYPGHAHPQPVPA
jgi:hypothetical protein